MGLFNWAVCVGAGFNVFDGLVGLGVYIGVSAELYVYDFGLIWAVVCRLLMYLVTLD